MWVLVRKACGVYVLVQEDLRCVDAGAGRLEVCGCWYRKA